MNEIVACDLNILIGEFITPFLPYFLRMVVNSNVKGLKFMRAFRWESQDNYYVIALILVDCSFNSLALM